MGEGGTGGDEVTRDEVMRIFADQGIDVQAWPWWIWIDIIVEHKMAKLKDAVNPTQETPK
jgi:hypothetical protein